MQTKSTAEILEDTARALAPETEQASKEWGLNCGPGALCAVSGLSPDEIRPYSGEFEKLRYTPLSLMLTIARDIGLHCTTIAQALPACPRLSFQLPMTEEGLYLVRVQWGGPWIDEEPHKRLRHSHWIAAHLEKEVGAGGLKLWDVNAPDQWYSPEIWRTRIATWLLRECEPQNDGTFWPSHVVRVRHSDSMRIHGSLRQKWLSELPGVASQSKCLDKTR